MTMNKGAALGQQTQTATRRELQGEARRLAAKGFPTGVIARHIGRSERQVQRYLNAPLYRD
jgi:hypothetical protein